MNPHNRGLIPFGILGNIRKYSKCLFGKEGGYALQSFSAPVIRERVGDVSRLTNSGIFGRSGNPGGRFRLLCSQEPRNLFDSSLADARFKCHREFLYFESATRGIIRVDPPTWENVFMDALTQVIAASQGSNEDE